MNRRDSKRSESNQTDAGQVGPTRLASARSDSSLSGWIQIELTTSRIHEHTILLTTLNWSESNLKRLLLNSNLTLHLQIRSRIESESLSTSGQTGPAAVHAPGHASCCMVTCCCQPTHCNMSLSLATAGAAAIPRLCCGAGTGGASW